MKRVLFASSEVYPFIKTGGLADVAFGLPKALKNMGIDVRIILPKYVNMEEKYKENLEFKASFNVKVGWRRQYCGIEYLEYAGIPVYFIDNEYYFKRDNAYGFFDDGERFAFFSRAILEVIKHIDFKPDIIHLNDWQTAMTSVLLNTQYRHLKIYKDIKTVYTIHNLKYQGEYGREILGELFELGEDMITEDKLEYHGHVNFMKGAINYSDFITTVSETYANEIQYDYFGDGLNGVLKKNSYKLKGIVNGIDYDIYNPLHDSYIPYKYDHKSVNRKSNNKESLQKQLNLPIDHKKPMISMITRLVDQKGLDLLDHIMDELMALDIQFVVLGTGDEKYENMMKYYEAKYPKKLKVHLNFNTTLAHRIYAGSDMFLMPSRFEPCGLGQLIALRYGTIPIVRETGGLKDTVVSYNKFDGTGNGFSFINYNAHEMLFTIKEAIDVYHKKGQWKKIISSAMKSDYSWERSASKYSDIYDALLGW